MPTPQEIKAIHDQMRACTDAFLKGRVSVATYQNNCAFFMPQILDYIKEQEGIE